MFSFRPSPARRFGVALLDGHPAGLAVYTLADPSDDASLRLVYANAAAAAVPGLQTAPGAPSPETLVGVAFRAACARAARTGRGERLGDDRLGGPAWRVHTVPLPDHSVGVVFELQQATEPAAAALPVPVQDARYQTLFEALADPILVYPIGPDGPGPIVAVNTAAVDLYGYSPDELAAMTITDLLVPGSISVPDTLDRLRRSRQATFESVHLTRDGRAVPVQTSARLVEIDGELCVLALARDDSERRAFQHDLSRANLGLERTVAARTADLQTFADALRTVQSITAQPFETPLARTEAFLVAGCEMLGMPVGILSATPLDPATGERLYRLDAVVSPDPSLHAGLVAPISEAFCDAVLERGEMVVHSDAAESAATACHPAYASRGLRSFIGTPIRLDGEIVGTLNFVSPAPRPAGFQPFERDLVEIMADAVARRLVADRAERERAQAEAAYRAVFETVEDGLITLRADGHVLMSNPAARALLGLRPAPGAPAGRLADRRPTVDATGRAVPEADLPEQQVFQTGVAVRGVIHGLVQPDGAIRWARVNAAPLDYDGDGRAEAVVLSLTDVTDLHAAIPAAA